MTVRRLALLALAAAALAAGCAGSEDEAAEPELPVAASREQWANRLRPFLIRMSRNLEVLNLLRHPDVRFHLYTRNETTIRTLNRTLEDLQRCSSKLDRVGMPPRREAALGRAYTNFRRACPHYERLADLLIEAVPLVISGNEKEIAKGQKLFQQASEPSRLAAENFQRALDILRAQKLFTAAEPA